MALLFPASPASPVVPDFIATPVAPVTPLPAPPVFPLYAPYLINVATPNNKVRHPSRKLLKDTCKVAASFGAKGVIVHGGSVGEGGDIGEGYDNWRKEHIHKIGRASCRERV